MKDKWWDLNDMEPVEPHGEPDVQLESLWEQLGQRKRETTGRDKR